MIMIAEIGGLASDFAAFSDALALLGKDKGLDVRCMHQDIFDAMHKI